MKHRISPTVDCVFKSILGSEENTNLLIDFLNGVLAPQFPISDVEILNPYNEREFYSDKLTIVDVKAKDEKGTAYQIEIQLAVFSYFPERMLYTWSDIYQSQLQSGEPFSELRPVISIWMLTENLIPESPAFHHHFQLVDQEHNDHSAEHPEGFFLEQPDEEIHQPVLLPGFTHIALSGPNRHKGGRSGGCSTKRCRRKTG